MSVYTIPPCEPFLPCLIESLFDGHLIEGYDFNANPHSLTQVTLLLPNRRSVQISQQIFLEKSAGNVAFLPRLIPLREVALHDFCVLSPIEEAFSHHPLSSAERLAALSHLVKEHPFGKAPSLEEILTLAKELSGFIDEKNHYAISWEKLDTLVPGLYTQYWSKILDFLKIVQTHWPAYLEQQRKRDETQRQTGVLRAVARHFQENSFDLPLIVAGSTGSLPAVAALLKEVARLPKGCVVLPGLDQTLDQEGWEAISPSPQTEREDAEAHAPSRPYSQKISGHLPTHPQYHLKKCLDHMGLSRQEVISLHQKIRCDNRTLLESRALCISQAFHSEGAGKTLTESQTERFKSFRDMTLITAENEWEEALAIALVARESIGDGKRVLLITPDPHLTHCVATQMQRWHIHVDTSLGTPLAKTSLGTVSLLLARYACLPFDPHSFLALLKHPLVHLGLPNEQERQKSVAFLERHILRCDLQATWFPLLYGQERDDQKKGVCGHQQLLAAVERARLSENPRGEETLPDHWQNLVHILQTLSRALAHFRFLTQPFPAEIPLAHLSEDHEQALRALLLPSSASPEEDPFLSYVSRDSWEKYNRLVDDIRAIPETVFPLSVVADWPDFLSALLYETSTHAPPDSTEAFRILMPVEARLMTADVVILGGLNEGTWPEMPRERPAWLNRSMRLHIGLPPPEHSLGRGAHDFCQALGARQSVLTRCARQGDKPARQSRWLERLCALLSERCVGQMRARGEKYERMARHLLSRPHVPRATPPNPKPCPSLRPYVINVTEVEKWVKTPYDFYVRRILNMRPLPPLNPQPDEAAYGTLFHAILAAYVPLIDKAPPREEIMHELLLERLAHIQTTAKATLFWKKRFMRSLRWLVRNTDFKTIKQCLTEEKLKMTCQIDGAAPDERHAFILQGRADRIDINDDGSLSIIDYKTGSVLPSKKEIMTLSAPQLLLQGVLCRAHHMSQTPKAIRELTYIWLRGHQNKCQQITQECLTLIETAEKELIALFRHYQNPDTGYQASHTQKQRSDYDHLARRQEWGR